MIHRESYPDPPAEDLLGPGKRKPDSSQGFRFPTPEKPGIETKMAYFKRKRWDNTRLPALFCRDHVGERGPIPGDFCRDQVWVRDSTPGDFFPAYSPIR
jgi:hypothetical protein